MGKYRIFIQKSAQKSLARIQKQDRERIVQVIKGLNSDARPPGSKKLSARDAWRVRIGAYRVIYEIHDNSFSIQVVVIGKRSEIYR